MNNKPLPPIPKEKNKSNLFVNMSLKPFDRNEEVKIPVVEDKRNIQRNLHHNFQDLLKKKYEKYSNIQVSFRKRLKAIVIAIDRMMVLYKLVHNFKVHAHDVRKKDMLMVYSVNLVLIKSWVVEKEANFFRNIINSSEPLDYTQYELTDKDNIEAAVKKLKFKMNIFLKELDKAVISDLPLPVVTFLYEMAQHGAYLPDKFLSYFEKSHLSLDEYGTLFNVTLETKQFIWLYTIFVTVSFENLTMRT